jgi:hypothetical protein
MKVLKENVKTYSNKKGQKIEVVKVLSEYNKNQKDVTKEKFDIKYSEVKRIHDKLKASNRKFIIQGLNERKMCLISNIDGDFIYKDSQEYLNGKDENYTASEFFSQLIITFID